MPMTDDESETRGSETLGSRLVQLNCAMPQLHQAAALAACTQHGLGPRPYMWCSDRRKGARHQASGMDPPSPVPSRRL